MKRNNDIVNHLKKWWWAYTLLCILLFLFVVMASEKFLYEIPEEFTRRTGVPVNMVAVQQSNKLFRLLDEVNIFYFKKNLNDGSVQIYDLKLSPADIKHFSKISRESVKQGYLDSKINTWRKAELKVNDTTYDIEIKLHGDLPPHWNSYLKSYKVKLENGSINGLSRFNLIIFEDRLLVGEVSRLLASELGLFDVQNSFIALRVNGVSQGVYYLEEDIGKDFLERNECSNCMIVKTTDNWIEDHPRAGDKNLNGITDGPGHGTDFDDIIANYVLEGELDARHFFPVLDEFFLDVQEADTEAVASYFDIDYISSFEAFRLLIGSAHLIHGDNLRLAYSASTGKFYPVSQNQEIRPLTLERGGIEHTINQDKDTLSLFSTIAHNEKIRHLRNKKIYSFIEMEGEQFLERYGALSDFYLPRALSYKTNSYSNKYMKYQFKKTQEVLRGNMNIIKKNLEYAKAYLGIFNRGNNVSIILTPDSIAEIKFSSLQLLLDDEYKGKLRFVYTLQNQSVEKEMLITEPLKIINITPLVSEMYFSAAFDEEMYPERRDYLLEIFFDDVEKISLSDIEIKMINDITQQNIEGNDLYINIADENKFYRNSKEKSFAEMKRSYPQLHWQYQDGRLLLQEGRYTITEDLIIPQFTEFTIEEGTTLLLGENVSIVSYSPVTIKGSPTKNVIITSLDETKPYGTFGIIGSGEKTSIEGLDISHGREAIINGVYFSGGLSIHGMDVSIRKSKIHGHFADDGLNIKYGEVSIDDVEFYGNFADQFDCDFCIGVIRNSRFDGSVGEDANGDGLDLSGSQVIVKGNTFAFFNDKGASIGEGTEAIFFQNTFTQNNLGAAIKDSSHAFFFENTFDENTISLSAYQKKLLFVGGKSYSYENALLGDGKEYVKDGASNHYKLNLQDYHANTFINHLKKEEVKEAFELIQSYKK